MDRPQNEISIAKLLGLLFQITEQFQMETQPQLLLLQKTMLVAEGTGRKLAPDANMWMLARPLVEAWMAEQLGPEARLRETVDTLAGALDRLPKILDRVEESSGLIAGGRVRLHPDTVAALRGEQRSGFTPLSLGLLALIALLLVVLLV